MVIRKAFVAAATSALIFGSTAAIAAPGAELRMGSAIAESEELGGSSGFGIIVALLIAAGVIGVILADNDEDLPTSP